MKAFELVENSDLKFDYIWFLRPDVIYKDTLPLRWLNWVKPDKFIVPKFDSCKGINDRMAILTFDQAKIYATRFNLLHNYGKVPKRDRIASEKFLIWVMNKYKIKQINYLFKRLRANGHFHIKDDKLF